MKRIILAVLLAIPLGLAVPLGASADPESGQANLMYDR